MGWSDHHIMGSESLKSSFQDGCRQVWAVAVEGDGASLMTFPLVIFYFATSREMRKHGNEACSKAFTFLRNYARCVAC